tara:strand:+ start:55 stop:303 length:249 start_codon:yes stop_codon:yes gene_type:complete
MLNVEKLFAQDLKDGLAKEVKQLEEGGTVNLNIMKSRGLGDSIEKFTKATGIKRVADLIPGGCGCDDRKEWFNKNFPYNMNK